MDKIKIQIIRKNNFKNNVHNWIQTVWLNGNIINYNDK